jgi:NAD(P)-dependent dehydrogenase (short-subunit alcohol dehydrogenase family)
MKQLTILLLSLLLSIQIFAEDKPKEVKSTIKQVTVFTKGAQVSREANASIPKGNSIIKFIGISPNIDKNSIQVKADGDFIVLSVVHQLNYFETPIKTEEIEKLKTDQLKLQDQIEDENTLLLVLNEEESLILTNKSLAGQQSGVQIDQLRATAEFYRTRIKEIRLEKLGISRKLKDIQKKISQIQLQLNELNYRERTNTTEVVLAISSKKATSGKFLISYLVNNAGWTPHYDLRVKDVKSPVQLSYKANVYQTSGETWEDVMLTLSTGDPSQSGTKPTLNPWRLNFYNPTYAYGNNRYQAGAYSGAFNGTVRRVQGVIMDETGEPLIGANVMIKGSTIGTSTDINGSYTLDIPDYAKVIIVSYTGYNSLETAINSNNMNLVLSDSGMLLDEVVVTGYGAERKRKRQKSAMADVATLAPTQPVPVQEIEKATTVSFKIDIPYDVPSDGKQYVVQMKDHELPAYYEYYCAPKIDLDAFLTAQITGWEELNLLNGEANLFFEGTYLGKSYLDVQSVDDTLDLSLGRDQNIVVLRTRQKENTKKKFMSNKRVDTRAWDIEVRNKKKLPINIVIEDQIPIAVTEEIEVEKDYKNAAFEEDTGKLTWKFELKPNSTEKLNFKYTVKYPKKKKVMLE